jgi:hypothetical protein
MTTAGDLINRAAKVAGLTFKGESLSADEAAEALATMNAMLDHWSNDDFITFSRVRESFTTTGGVAAYTMGVGGMFNTARPIDITAMFIRIGTIDYPIEQTSNYEYETEIPNKSLPSPIPRYFNYSNEYPLTTITLYPVPSAAYSLFIISNKPLGTYTSLTDTVSLPVGVERAIVYNLANELSIIYGQPTNPSVMQIAKETLGGIKSQTNSVNPNKPEDSYVKAWNYLGGWS